MINMVKPAKRMITTWTRRKNNHCEYSRVITLMIKTEIKQTSHHRCIAMNDDVRHIFHSASFTNSSYNMNEAHEGIKRCLVRSLTSSTSLASSESILVVVDASHLWVVRATSTRSILYNNKDSVILTMYMYIHNTHAPIYIGNKSIF